MIRFGCPACKALLECPDTKASSKINCPKCGQRLQIPALPNRTILAPLVAHCPEPRPVGAPALASSSAPYPHAIPLSPPVLMSVALDRTATPSPSPDPMAGAPLWHRLISSRWRWPASIAGAVLISALCVCLFAGAVKYLIHAPGEVAEAREKPRTDEEELVRRFIVNNSGHDIFSGLGQVNPQPVQPVTFTRWGPHMKGRELLLLLKEGGAEQLAEKPATAKELEDIEKSTLIRVCYRDTNPRFPFGTLLVRQTTGPDCDEVYVVRGKIVKAVGPTPEGGDEWKKTFRQRLAQFMPAIKVGS